MIPQTTPRSERLHIGIFGKRNAGKSSLLNAITGQNVAVVSPVKGTTTDPVFKTMELLPLGPIVLIDTPGFDDVGGLGELRVEKTRNILRKTDIAILVVDDAGITTADEELVALFDATEVKYIIVYNKNDLVRHCEECKRRSNPASTCGSDCITLGAVNETAREAFATLTASDVNVSRTASLAMTGENPFRYNSRAHTLHINAQTGENIDELKNLLSQIKPTSPPPRPLVADLLRPHDTVILVTPIDEAAPKGRLILPQQQVIRNILAARAIPILTQPEELPATLASLLHPPKMVITDSQAFKQVAEILLPDTPLTSFSILMARYKGVLQQAIEGAHAIDGIRTGDNILISEGCTHRRQCDDIATVKIPRGIESHTGAKPIYTFSSGGEFPQELSIFKLIIHCGGCMLNNREMLYRQDAAMAAGIPITNFGVVLSHIQGILPRCIAPLRNSDCANL